MAAVGDYKRENYKTEFEIAQKHSKLQSEGKNIELSRPQFYLTPVCAKAFQSPFD